METFSPVFVEPEKSSSSPELPRLPYRHSSTASGMSDSIAGGIQQDDEVWTRYLAVASIVDSRMIDDWTKIIDVILVYVALLSGVLTAFIIETSTEFERDPADITNDLLVTIYKQLADPSTPFVDPADFFKLEPAKRTSAVYRNSLLYVSLALAVVVSALATASKLWVIRYSSEVTASGSPHERALARQRAYNGMRAWRLEAIIESMPVLSLIAVVMFGLFIHSSVGEEQMNLGYGVGVILLLGLAFLLVTSFSAAFIPAAPFHSSFSDFIHFIFRIFPEHPRINLGAKGTIRVRTLLVVCSAIVFLGGAAFLVIKNTAVFIPIVFYPIACVFALMRRGSESDIKPRVLDLPGWVSFSTIVIFTTFAIAAYFSPKTGVFLLFFCVASILLAVQGYVGIKMSARTPQRIEADAIAWMMKSSVEQDARLFKKAVDIAGRSANLRSLLLDELLPLLTPLIISIHGDKKIATEDQAVYLECLAGLTQFSESEGAFWKNESSVRRPTLSTPFRMKLSKLRNTQCPDRLDDSRGKLGNFCDHGQDCPYPRLRVAAGTILSAYDSDTVDDTSPRKHELRTDRSQRSTSV